MPYLKEHIISNLNLLDALKLDPEGLYKLSISAETWSIQPQLFCRRS
jgi:hypothetical protein